MTQRRRRREPEAKFVGGPTPERMAKAGEAFEVGHTGRITIRDAPLEWAHTRGIIDGDQYQVGVKHRHHWHHAGLQPRFGGIDLDRVISGVFGATGTETQEHHRRQYRAAIEALGQRIGALVDNVCCHEMSLADAGYKLGWKNRDQGRAVATEMLREGLDILKKL